MNDRQFKMGSLFDGSGGFPLASTLCGIEPVWASEIEPFPIKVTRARFPNMKHYGDISKIDVNEIETVDLISGGSPCQDMSVAGKRQGMSKQCPKCDFKVEGNVDIKECPNCGTELEYTRSGLFMEQIRIVKEMRKKDELEQLRSGRTDEHIRPRFMLWENVVGAFSSNKGEDFRAVLEETAKIKDPTATIPRPPKGKWNTSGLIVGDGYSIAWRVLDAQYWGVPQRRRRIALVADFGGQCAGEILFKRNGLSRNFTQSKQAWQGTARYSTQSIGETSQSCVGFDRYNQCETGDKCETLRCPNGGDNYPIVFEPGAASRVGNHTYENQCGTLRANMGDNQFAVAMEGKQFSAGFCPEQSEKTRGIGYEEGKSPTLRAGVVPAAIKEEQYSVDFGRTADRIQMNADKSVTLLGEGGGAGAKTGLYCLPKIMPVGINGDVAGTLDSNYWKGPGARAGTEREVVAIPIQKDLYCMATQQGGAEIMNDLAPTITAAAGMSGNNQPVINQPIAYRKTAHPRNAEEGQGWEEANVNDTLNVFDIGEMRTPTLVAEPIPIQDQAISNGSGNGLGIGKADDPMYTLMADTQHGVAYSLQGNMIGREDHNGPQGSGVNEDVAFTLNATDRHAVVYAVDQGGGKSSCSISDGKSPTLTCTHGGEPAVVYGIDRAGFNQGENAQYDFSVLDDQAQTLIARGPNGVCHESKTYQKTTGPLMANSHPGSYTEQDAHNDMFVANEYIVRRLTPLECSRLQGFPDWWCDGLQIEKPNGHDIAFWREVFETHREIVTGASKPKTDKQIVKWLKEEPNDGAMYKMWGNGIALPCFLYVIEGIKEVLERTSNSNSSTTATIEN